ncbi:MAG: CARDB domain-containing protein [Bacteroidota bacterium]|nr:CARDB domain-containing protein [Bacteroidota bacterium]
MRKVLTATFILVFCLGFQSFGQISEGGQPVSFTNSNIPVEFDFIQIQKPNISIIEIEDKADEKNGTFRKNARILPTLLNMNNSGVWTELKDGGRLWRLKIKSEGALALAVYYNEFYLPPKSKLFLYNADKQHVLGAYTESNNPDNGFFANELIQGDEVTLEYYEPAGISKTAEIQIDGIAYVYRDIVFSFTKSIDGFGDSGYCQVNVNCSPEGSDWQDEKRGAVRIFLISGSSGGWCSGSLINNVKQDCTPYLLTADHCGMGASASNFSQWVFYFNYESSGCSNPSSAPSYNSKTGCVKKAAGGNGGSTGSDFLLLELNSDIPSSYNAYFNGWDKRNIVSHSGVSIHHPMGDIKKISTYTTNLSSYQWGSASGSHWLVYWTGTANGHGVTEGGSSGSPIFNSEGRIIGDLTGGSSYCSQTGNPDLYGKLSYSWQSNGTSASQRLKNWLDPDDTGIETLNGKENDCGLSAPDADFVVSDTLVILGSTVNFTDLSEENPHHWYWNFESATVDTSIQQNPYSVYFDSIGSFDVTLIVWNDYGFDTLTFVDYITVVPVPADLDIINHSISQNILVEGDSVSLTANVKNHGQSPAISNYLKFYLSDNSYYDASDLLLDSVLVIALNNQQTVSLEKQVQIPFGTTPGNYFIIYMVDADNVVFEGNENNNTALKVITVLEALPDFQIENIAVDSSQIHPGASTAATCQVLNSGNIDGIAGEMKVYLSDNSTYESSSDELLYTENYVSLPENSADSLSFSLQIPFSTSYGDYYLLFIADANNQQAELSETNNLSFEEIRVLYPLNIEELVFDNDFNLVPNPNSGVFSLLFNNDDIEDLSIEIINILGETVYSEKHNRFQEKINFDLKYLRNGIYFLKVKIDGEITTKPFVKE